MVRNVGRNDPEAFADLVQLADWLTKVGVPLAAYMQRENGYSWADLARPMPVTRSAVVQRFGRFDGARLSEVALTVAVETPDLRAPLADEIVH